MLRKEKDAAVDTAVIVEDGVRRSAASGAEYKAYAKQYAKDWMGKDTECWVHFEHGCVDGMRERGGCRLRQAPPAE